MTRLIRIEIEVPDNAELRIAGGAPDDLGEALPAPWWHPDDDHVATVRTMPVDRRNAAAGVCPKHGVGWKRVPAGVSKRTAQPYPSFMACPVSGCDERPPAIRRTAS